MKKNTCKRNDLLLCLLQFCSKKSLILLLLAFTIQTVNVSAGNNWNSSNTKDEVQAKKTVKGKIVDNESGEPIFMATVAIKGAAIGTYSDIDGMFTMEYPADIKSPVLLVTYVGYLSIEEPIENRTVIDITMKEDAASLEEVIVVGYGVQKKASLTGSVAQIKGGDIMQSPAANLSNSLAGRMSGVVVNNRSGEPGADAAEIFIRGASTMGDSRPLYVIDGVANRGGIDRLNPSDIESISVLKDASAAIYGAQAANGVILVTTKKGKTGKPMITYDGSFSLNSFTKRPELMNSYQYMVYADEISERYGRTQVYKDVKGGYLDGTIDRLQYGDTNWMDAVFSKTAPQTQHSLSIRGGSEKVSYYVSGGLLHQKPQLKDTPYQYKTFQIRSNIDAQITKDLKLSVEMTARQEDNNKSNLKMSTMFWEALHAYPFLHDYYPNGLPGAGLAWGNNMALMANGASGYDKIREIYMNNRVAFDLNMPWITEGLSASGYVAYDIRYYKQKKFSNQWDAYRYNPKTEAYDNIRPTTGEQGYINLTQHHYDENMTSAHLRLAYAKSFGNHNVSAFVAYEQSKHKTDWFEAYRQGFLSDKVVYLSEGGDDQKNNNGGASSTINKDITGGIVARQNYFGRLNYDYQGKYLTEFTLRRDGSQNFASNERWGWFPGMSLGWRVSDEDFFKVGFVNDLKVKASWGKLGNDRISPFQFLEEYKMYDGPQFGMDPKRLKGFSLLKTGNPAVTWEKVDTKNFGFESYLLNSSLMFNVGYFISKRKDILTQRLAAVPDYTGLVLPDENLGKVDNQGIEIELMYRNKVSDVKYYVGGNFTYAKSEVKFKDEAPGIPAWQRETGRPLKSWSVFKTDGIYKTQEEIDNSPHLSGTKIGDIKYLDIDGDKKITDEDKVRIPLSNVPQIVYGISMGAEWKGFELNMLWSGQAKAKQFIRPYSYNFDVTYFNNRWTPENPDAKYPRAFERGDNYNARLSDFWLKDASFLRLKNLELAYNFNSSVLNTLKVSGLRVYLSGSNLFNVIDHIKIQDPEGSTEGSGMYYPQARTFSMGVNVSF